MSTTLEEKLAPPPAEDAGPARCTLGQLESRWGRLVEPPRPWRIGSVFLKYTMGEPEAWRVTSAGSNPSLVLVAP